MGDSGSMLSLGVRLFFSLALVLGLLVLIARFANRRFKGRVGAPIQVVHRQQLSRSSSVAVITVGTRVLVLGSTEQQVTLLTEVEPDEVGLDPDTMLPEVGETDETPDAVGVAAFVPAAWRNAGAKSTPGSALNGSLLSAATWRRTWEQFRPAAARPETSAPSASEDDRRAS